MFKIIKLIIVIIGIYIAVVCTIPWVKYYVFKNSAYKVINISNNNTHSEVVELLLDKAEELNINISKANITLEEYEEGMIYTISYKTIVGFPVVENKIIFAHEFEKLRYK